jgi:very-short-patch-repair endonuclease
VSLADAALKAGWIGTPPASDFAVWAAKNGFAYPEWAHGFLSLCDSAAEAYLARAFAEMPDGRAAGDDRTIIADGCVVAVQHGVGLYRADFLVGSWLVVEVDGHGFHHARPEQVAKDYRRERALISAGYTVIRFTAAEVFASAAACALETLRIARSARA